MLRPLQNQHGQSQFAVIEVVQRESTITYKDNDGNSRNKPDYIQLHLGYHGINLQGQKAKDIEVVTIFDNRIYLGNDITLLGSLLNQFCGFEFSPVLKKVDYSEIESEINDFDDLDFDNFGTLEELKVEKQTARDGRKIDMTKLLPQIKGRRFLCESSITTAGEMKRINAAIGGYEVKENNDDVKRVILFKPKTLVAVPVKKTAKAK